MVTAIDTEKFESVDFTTLAVVKAEIDQTTTSTALDSEISEAITQVSAAMTRYLGFHTLIATRTDTYFLRHGKRMLTLDARPVTADPSSLQIVAHPDDFASATEIDSRDFVLRRESGSIRFSRRMSHNSAYVKVVYSGGLAANATDMIADYPELSLACTLQVKYLQQRRDAVGGNVKTVSGAGTEFTSQYSWLSTTRRTLDALRRAAV